MTFAPRSRLPPAATPLVLAFVILLGDAALATTKDQMLPTLPLPPMTVSEALAAMPALQPAGQLPLPGGLTLHLALPQGDHCSPQAAWLLCPGLRLASRGAGGDAPVVAAWHTSLPQPPLALATLRQAALDRYGPPAREERVVERRRGLDLVQHRMGWTLTGHHAPLWLEAVFVLQETEAQEGPAPLVQRIGWSATPEAAAQD